MIGSIEISPLHRNRGQNTADMLLINGGKYAVLCISYFLLEEEFQGDSGHTTGIRSSIIFHMESAENARFVVDLGTFVSPFV